MAEELTIDQALAEIMTLSAKIEALDPGDPKREALEQQRDDLRADARRADDTSRSLPVLLNELGALQRRLEQIDSRPIHEGWSEKARDRGVRWLNDPGAYSNKINEMLNSEDADERAAIVTRIGEIEAVLKQRADYPAAGAEH